MGYNKSLSSRNGRGLSAGTTRKENMQFDFAKHNKEVVTVWDAYRKGKPIRVPIQFTMNPRMIICDPKLNKWRYSWKDYFENADARWNVDLEFQKWVRFNVVQDAEMGLPEREWGGIEVVFQNCDEAAWFGCPIIYPKEDMPFVEPILKNDKGRLYSMSPPSPLSGGIMEMAIEQYEYLEEKRRNTDFEGKSVGKTSIFGGGTDGPLTIACNIRGANEIAIDFYEDPKYLRDLLSFITDVTIVRIKKVMGFLKIEYPAKSWMFADDSIELISKEMYKDFVLPCHKRLLAEFSKGDSGIHICGKVQRHLKILKYELDIKIFDVGFPIDMGKAREDLGEDVTLIGNIAPHLLKMGPEQAIKDEIKKTCESGVMKGGKFILREGSNCAPGTPISHYQAMYEAGKEYGRY